MSHRNKKACIGKVPNEMRPGKFRRCMNKRSVIVSEDRKAYARCAECRSRKEKS